MTTLSNLQVFQSFQFRKGVPRDVRTTTQRVIWDISDKDTVSDYDRQVFPASVSAHSIFGIRTDANSLRAIIERSNVRYARITHRIRVNKKCASISNDLRFDRRRGRHRCGDCTRVVFGRSNRTAPQSSHQCRTDKELFHFDLHVIRHLSRNRQAKIAQPLNVAGVAVVFERDAGTGGGRSAQDTPKIGFQRSAHDGR